MALVKTKIKNRVELVDNEELCSTLEDFDQVIERWCQLADDLNSLTYSQYNLPKTTMDPWPLLINTGQEKHFRDLVDDGKALTNEYPFEKMTSLRNTDTESSLYIFTE